MGTESSQVFMQRGTISGQEPDDGENGWKGDEDVRGLATEDKLIVDVESVVGVAVSLVLHVAQIVDVEVRVNVEAESGTKVLKICADGIS